MDYTRDTDPVETQEWLDSLEGVIEVEGPERAHFLLNRVMDGARRRAPRSPTRPIHPTSHEGVTHWHLRTSLLLIGD